MREKGKGRGDFCTFPIQSNTMRAVTYQFMSIFNEKKQHPVNLKNLADKSTLYECSILGLLERGSYVAPVSPTDGKIQGT